MVAGSATPPVLPIVVLYDAEWLSGKSRRDSSRLDVGVESRVVVEEWYGADERG